MVKVHRSAARGSPWAPGCACPQGRLVARRPHGAELQEDAEPVLRARRNYRRVVGAERHLALGKVEMRPFSLRRRSPKRRGCRPSWVISPTLVCARETQEQPRISSAAPGTAGRRAARPARRWRCTAGAGGPGPHLKVQPAPGRRRTGTLRRACTVGRSPGGQHGNAGWGAGVWLSDAAASRVGAGALRGQNSQFPPPWGKGCDAVSSGALAVGAGAVATSTGLEAGQTCFRRRGAVLLGRGAAPQAWLGGGCRGRGRGCRRAGAAGTTVRVWNTTGAGLTAAGSPECAASPAPARAGPGRQRSAEQGHGGIIGTPSVPPRPSPRCGCNEIARASPSTPHHETRHPQGRLPRRPVGGCFARPGQCHYATGIAHRLQQVLDDSATSRPRLRDLYDSLNAGRARHASPSTPSTAWHRCRAPTSACGHRPTRTMPSWRRRRALPASGAPARRSRWSNWPAMRCKGPARTSWSKCRHGHRRRCHTGRGDRRRGARQHGRAGAGGRAPLMLAQRRGAAWPARWSVSAARARCSAARPLPSARWPSARRTGHRLGAGPRAPTVQMRLNGRKPGPVRAGPDLATSASSSRAAARASRCVRAASCWQARQQPPGAGRPGPPRLAPLVWAVAESAGSKPCRAPDSWLRRATPCAST